LDSAVDRLLEYVVRDFVSKWYADVGTDKEMPMEALCSGLNTILQLSRVIGIHAFAPLEALPCM
jgi:hypothetical protein